MQQEPRESRAQPSPEVTAPVGQQGYMLAAPVLRFDLGSLAEELRRQDSYKDGVPTGRTLVKEPDLRIVIMALRAGTKLEEHHASGPISIQVLEGAIRLRVAGESVDLRPGGLVTIEPSIPHDVDAINDAAFLLTIGRTTYQHVSDRHEPHR